jgi:hypothetical protein
VTAALSQSNTLMTTLSAGSYALSFEYSTKVAEARSSALIKNTFHITILIASQEFLTNQYVK